MAYETKVDLTTEKAITLGGKGEDGRANPTSLEGYYIGSKTTPDKGFGEGKLHIFQTAEGNVGVWGKTHLNGLLTSELVGQMCLVSFTGMSTPPKGRRAAYRYEVKHDRSNRIDVSSVDFDGAQAADDEDDNSYESDSVDAGEEVGAIYNPPARPVARAVTAPSAESQARTQALLNGRAKRA